MAKNTSSSAFRRVDVDQYTEGKYEEDALTDDGVNGPNDTEIQAMLAQYPYYWIALKSYGTDDGTVYAARSVVRLRPPYSGPLCCNQPPRSGHCKRYRGIGKG